MTDHLLVPSFHQIPYSTLVQRIDSGSQGIFELSHFLHERVDAEDAILQYTTKVSRSNLFHHEIHTSSSERLLGFFKNYNLFVSKALLRQQKDFKDSVVKDMDQLKVDRATKVNKQKATIQNLLADIAIAEDFLSKAKKAHAKAKSDYLRAQQKLIGLEKAVLESQKLQEEKRKEGFLGKEFSQGNQRFSMGRMFSAAFESTPEQERDRYFMKVLKRSDEMNNAYQVILQKRKRLLELYELLDLTYQKSTTIYQNLEIERMNKLKDVMKKYIDTERSLLDTRREQLQIFEDAVNLQNTDDDILLFIHQARSAENVHKYSSALHILDEYLFQKPGDAAEYSDKTVDLESIEILTDDYVMSSSSSNKPSFSTGTTSTATTAPAPAPANTEVDLDKDKDTTSLTTVSEALKDTKLSSTEEQQPHHTTRQHAVITSSSSSHTTAVTAQQHHHHTHKKLHPLEEVPEDDTADEAAETEAAATPAEVVRREDTYAMSQKETKLAEESPKKSQKVLDPLSTERGEASSNILFTEGVDMTITELEPQEQEQQESSSTVDDMTIKLIEESLFALFVDTGKQPQQDNMKIFSVEDWSALFGATKYRERCLQILNQQRCHALLHPTAYASLSHAMEALLDFEMENLDTVANAMNISNMTNTFHTIREEHLSGHMTGSGTASDILPPEKQEKQYILNEPHIYHHRIWRREGFWEQALRESIFSEFGKSRYGMIYWDQLSNEALRERVIGLHNTIFGQLGTLSFAMIQLGFSPDEVTAHIRAMCYKFQLTEEQEYELIGNISGKRVKEYTAPAVLPVVQAYPINSTGSSNSSSSSHSNSSHSSSSSSSSMSGHSHSVSSPDHTTTISSAPSNSVGNTSTSTTTTGGNMSGGSTSGNTTGGMQAGAPQGIILNVTTSSTTTISISTTATSTVSSEHQQQHTLSTTPPPTTSIPPPLSITTAITSEVSSSLSPLPSPEGGEEGVSIVGIESHGNITSTSGSIGSSGASGTMKKSFFSTLAASTRSKKFIANQLSSTSNTSTSNTGYSSSITGNNSSSSTSNSSASPIPTTTTTAPSSSSIHYTNTNSTTSNTNTSSSNTNSSGHHYPTIHPLITSSSTTNNTNNLTSTNNTNPNTTAVGPTSTTSTRKSILSSFSRTPNTTPTSTPNNTTSSTSNTPPPPPPSTTTTTITTNNPITSFSSNNSSRGNNNTANTGSNGSSANSGSGVSMATTAMNEARLAAAKALAASVLSLDTPPAATSITTNSISGSNKVGGSSSTVVEEEEEDEGDDFAVL